MAEEPKKKSVFAPPVAVGFRVILPTESGEKQIAGTVSFPDLVSRLSLKTVLGYIYDLCEIDEKKEYVLVGVEGGKRVPLATDSVVFEFFKQCKITYPSVEVLPSTREQRDSDQAIRDRRKVDHVYDETSHPRIYRILLYLVRISGAHVRFR